MKKKQQRLNAKIERREIYCIKFEFVDPHPAIRPINPQFVTCPLHEGAVSHDMRNLFSHQGLAVPIISAGDEFI